MSVLAVDGSKITNECRAQSKVCGAYSRIITKTRYNVVIYIIQRVTILSQQKDIHDWNSKLLPVLESIYMQKWLIVIVVSDLRNVILKINAPLDKHRIKNAKNLTCVAAFNRKKQVVSNRLVFVKPSNPVWWTPTRYGHLIITDSLLFPWGTKALDFFLNSTP